MQYLSYVIKKAVDRVVVKEDDFQAFKKVNMPIVFTPGNHDFYPGIENVCRAAKKRE